MSLGKSKRSIRHVVESAKPEIEAFFAFARERNTIRLIKKSNADPPWTNDPILQQFRFCNVFREDDSTTQWFKHNIRERLYNKPVRAVLATVGFRWFNRIDTGELIADILLDKGWDGSAIKARLKGVSPLVTGAYMIKTPTGMNKLAGILHCMKRFQVLPVLNHNNTLESAHKAIMLSPFMGSFMAYEVVTDLRHTSILDHATDIHTWANAGPGAARGLQWIFGRKFNYASTAAQQEMVSLMEVLLTQSRHQFHWPRVWREWEMREVEHTLCEYAKYRKAQQGFRLKRKYNV